MLHSVISCLLGDTGTVGTNLATDRHESFLLGFVLSLQIVNTGKLVGHLVLHLLDVLTVDFHLFVHASFKIGNLLQISSTSFDFYLKGSGSALSFVKLSLLEVEVLLHFFDLTDSWKSCLTVKVFGHMLEESSDRLLVEVHLSIKLLLLTIIFLGELVDLLLLRVEDFKLLLASHRAARGIRLVTQLVVDVSNVPVVVIDHFAHVGNVLLLLLDLTIVLLDAVHEALSSLREWEIVLVALKFEVVLFLLKISLFFAKNLGALFEIVLLQTGLSIHKSVGNFLKLLALNSNLALEALVFKLQPLVLVTLLRVQVVQACLVGEVNIADLLLVRVRFVLHVTVLSKKGIEVPALLIVLTLDVLEKSFDVLRLSFASVLVLSQVVVGQVTFKLANILDQGLVLAFKSEISGIIRVNGFHLCLHLVDLSSDVIVLVPHQVVVVIAIVDLTTRSSCLADNA